MPDQSTPSAQAPPADAHLADRLAWVGAQIARLAHDTEVRGKDSYTATSVDLIADTTRPLLAAAGVAIVPAVTVVERHDEVVSRNGAKGYHVVLNVTWNIIAAGSQGLTAGSTGASIDYSDKAYNKAHTYARKNLLVALLNLSTGENVEAETPDAGHTTAQHAAPPAAQRGGGRQHSQAAATPAPPPAPAKSPEELGAERIEALVSRGAKDDISPEDVMDLVVITLGIDAGDDPPDVVEDRARTLISTLDNWNRCIEALRVLVEANQAATTGRQAEGTGGDGEPY